MIRSHSSFLTLAVALLACGPALAADPAAAPGSAWTSGSLTFITENDKWAFRGEDRHYTNGVRMSWVSDIIHPTQPSPWRWAHGLAGFIPTFDPAGELRVGISLGQSVYTPGDDLRTDRILDDRPYAGWLYGGFALINERRREPQGVDTLDTFEVNLGIVGPGAGGRVVQNRWHNLLAVDEAKGWSNQLPNEPGIVLYYERKWRDPTNLKTRLIDDLAIDVIPHAALSLGNVATYAAGGATLRFGRNLDVDFGPPRIRPALSGSGHVRAEDEVGWYFFAGSEIRGVAYDIFLDGPALRSSQSVDRKPVVVDLQAGAAITWRSMRASYTYVIRTREFDGQKIPDRFGAFSLTFGF